MLMVAAPLLTSARVEIVAEHAAARGVQREVHTDMRTMQGHTAGEARGRYLTRLATVQVVGTEAGLG